MARKSAPPTAPKLSGQELLTVAHGPQGQTAAVDFANQRITAASPEAWRFLAWRFFDPKRQRFRLLPADHFEPLPSPPGTRLGLLE
jgi:hypothetical protein